MAPDPGPTAHSGLEAPHPGASSGYAAGAEVPGPPLNSLPTHSLPRSLFFVNDFREGQTVCDLQLPTQIFL